MSEPFAAPVGPQVFRQRALGLPQWLVFPCRDELDETALAQQSHESIVIAPANGTLSVGAKSGMGGDQDRMIESLRISCQQTE
jgi:hypothetical protein